MPLVDLSFGDSLDRLSVLQIKSEYIREPVEKVENIQREKNLLESALLLWCRKNDVSSEVYREHLANLVAINRLGWHQIDLVRKSISSDSKLNLHDEHLKMIHINDERISAKIAADKSVNYHFNEVKSYLN